MPLPGLVWLQLEHLILRQDTRLASPVVSQLKSSPRHWNRKTSGGTIVCIQEIPHEVLIRNCPTNPFVNGISPL